nr:hypothetical protein [Tanacetum cinerariifolium]
MSDSNESGVTYTEASPSPDYIPGPEEPEQAPPLPNYVPGPEHADDEIVAEDQPYAEDASPTTQSPKYVPESDLEAYPEEDGDEDHEEDHVDYLTDGGDDGDDEEGSSEDDKDDDMDIEADEEEEHPALADSVVVALPASDQASSAEETEPFETDESAAIPPPHPAYRMTARISIPALVPIPAWSDSEVARLLAMSTPSSSLLSPLSYHRLGFLFHHYPRYYHHLHLCYPQHYLLALFLLWAIGGRPEVTLPSQKRLGIALGPGYEVGESSSAAAAAKPTEGLRADYGFVATMDSEIRRDPERELGGYMREFETRVRRDTNEIYSRLDDEQSERQLLAGRLNTLFRDTHAYTRHLMKTEARLSREAWVRSMDASDLAREMLRADHRRFAEIKGLRTADHTRQQQLIQTLTVMQSLYRQVTPLQRQGQQGPAGGPTQPELPEEAGVERDTEETTDKEHSNYQGSTAHIQPSVVPISILESDVPKTQPKPNIPYPSRLNDQKLREKTTNQMEKFFQIFHDFHFDISFADALLFMPKFASMIKSLLTNKDNINLMPLSIWKTPSLPELTPTRMTLELADRSITHPKGVAKDVFVKVGKFHFPTNFVVVDIEADPRVPLILGRSFLRTSRALTDVYGEKITLSVNDESVTFNRTNCQIFFPTLTPFGESDFFLEEIEDFLNDESFPTGIENSLYDPEGDILYLEKLLNEDPFQLPSMNLKQVEETKAKSSIEEPSELELKELPSHLEYDFLEESNKLPVIIAKDLKDVEKEVLIKVLKSQKQAIASKISDIKGIDLRFCTHKILMEEDYKPAVRSQRRVNLKIHDVIKKEVIKLLDAGTIYSISDSPWFTRVMIKYGVTHRLATAYHPQTSGQVEVSNHGLKHILERTVGENHASWSDKLDDALWAFCTAFKTLIGCTPYNLTTGDHRKLQLNELNELRDQAYENFVIYKERTKKLHDSKIKNRIFSVGDQVLLFNSRLKIFSGKLKTRWSGPFTII